MAATPASVILNRLRAKQDTTASDFVNAVLHVLQNVDLMAEIATISVPSSHVSIPIVEFVVNFPPTCTVTTDNLPRQASSCYQNVGLRSLRVLR